MTADSAQPPLTAIIGASGALGFSLALRLARAGVPIRIGSRDVERGVATARRATERLAPLGPVLITGHANDDAASGADVVVLSVPFRNQSETLTNLRGALVPGQLLIDATVPLAAAVSGKATRMLGVWQGSAAQQALEMAPGRGGQAQPPRRRARRGRARVRRLARRQA